MKYAIIKENKVLNIIEADEANADRVADIMGAIAVQSDIAGIGQSYINGVFANDPPVVIPESPEVIAFRAELLDYITKLNAAYPAVENPARPALDLSINDAPAAALLKLKTSGVTWQECCTLDMLRRNLKDAEALA